jgi:hypothetical protein
MEPGPVDPEPCQDRVMVCDVTAIQTPDFYLLKTSIRIIEEFYIIAVCTYLLKIQNTVLI